MTILKINNLLFCNLVSKLITIVTNNFWSLKLVVNETFSCNVVFGLHRKYEDKFNMKNNVYLEQ